MLRLALGERGFEIAHDFRGSLAAKTLIGQPLLFRFDISFEALDFLLDPRNLRACGRLRFVDHADIEIGAYRNAPPRPYRRGARRTSRNSESEARRRIVSRFSSTSLRSCSSRIENLRRDFFLLGRSSFPRADCAPRRSRLQVSHFFFDAVVRPFGARLGKRRQRDRLRRPQRCGNRCHSSSVRNGMTGCSSRSAASSAANMFRHAGTATSRSAEVSCGFTHSMYQSQKSPQKK